MQSQKLIVVLTLVNVLLMSVSLVRAVGTTGDDPLPVLRGRALEIVDDRGRVRASIAVLPADPAAKMDDGTVGYPEAVLLRLVTSAGRPNIKLAATEDGSGLVLGGEANPAYLQLLARGATPLIKLKNKDGREQIIKQ